MKGIINFYNSHINSFTNLNLNIMNKKSLLFFSMAVLFAGLSVLKAQTIDGMKVSHAVSANEIIIDGIGDEDFWISAPSYACDVNANDAPPTDENDFSAHFKVAWDEQFFYIYTEVKDESVVFWTADDEMARAEWKFDNMEIFFNPDTIDGERLGDDGTQFRMNPGEGADLNHISGGGYGVGLAVDGALDDYVYVSTLTDDGYTIEGQIPWWAIIPDGLMVGENAVEPANALILGFDVNFGDGDDPEAETPREHIMNWNSTKTDGWKSTTDYGFMYLHKTAIASQITDITIDGVADEGYWDNMTAYPIDIVVNDLGPDDDSDLKATYKVAWDSEFLYLLTEVTDESIVTWSADDEMARAEWKMDNIEIFTNPDNAHGERLGDDGTQFRFNPGEGADVNHISGGGYGVGLAVDGALDDYEYAQTISGDGYVIEGKIPWWAIIPDGMDVTPGIGSSIGFDVNIGDADDESAETPREHITSWAMNWTDGWKNTTRYGLLTFGPEVETSNIRKLSTFESSIYPNPVSDELNVRSSSIIKQLTISNMVGQNIISISNINNDFVRVNTSELKTGVYIINVVNEKGAISPQKFIKR